MRTLTFILVLAAVLVVWAVALGLLVRENRRLRRKLRELETEQQNHHCPGEDRKDEF